MSQRSSKSQILWIGNKIRYVTERSRHHVRRFVFLYASLAVVLMTISVAFIIVKFLIFEYPLPWKVTDPENPKFEIQHFKPSDYRSYDEFRDAVSQILKKGMSKQQVDDIFRHADVRPHAYKRFPGQQGETPNVYYYTYSNAYSYWQGLKSMMGPEEHNWNVIIHYNENDRVTSIHVQPL